MEYLCFLVKRIYFTSLSRICVLSVSYQYSEYFGSLYGKFNLKYSSISIFRVLWFSIWCMPFSFERYPIKLWFICIVHRPTDGVYLILPLSLHHNGKLRDATIPGHVLKGYIMIFLMSKLFLDVYILFIYILTPY